MINFGSRRKSERKCIYFLICDRGECALAVAFLAANEEGNRILEALSI